MNYPIVIHKDKRSDYGVTVPDLPGCFSAGATLDEALAMAREAIELHLEGLIEEGLGVPKALSLEAHQKSADFGCGGPGGGGGPRHAIGAVDESRDAIPGRPQVSSG